ncbi:hypothetical protein ABZ442_06180 [Streptomyces triculaminicus]|uniref:hypothetical protein n=1 Tax=Streptomyces triculaminicus TaxID=2816232 RepID=UPI0033CE3FCB
MSHQQPGPYGGGISPQSPQQPNPYGQPGGYGQPDAYGQQPGPYGQQPVAGYGQQPGGYGYPGPYGHPGAQQSPYPAPYPAPYPPPVPPHGAGKGKAIGIALGAVIVVGAVVIGGFLFFAGGSSVPDDGKHYKLTSPERVVGEYELDRDAKLPEFSTAAKDDLKGMGVADPETLTGVYQTPGAQLTGKQIRFMGAWGRIKKPEAVVDNMFTGMRAANSKKSGQLQLVGSPKAVSPSGFDDGVMKCQTVRLMAAKTPAGEHPMMQLCIWADHSTTAAVFTVDMATAMAGKETSVDEAGQLTAKFRADVRVEIPKK